MTVVLPVVPRRVLALLLAALYAVGAFAGIVHVMLVEHARCAEHGEIVHTSGPLRGDDRVGYFEDARLHAGERATPHDEHDHCLVLAPASPALVTFTHADAVVALDESALSTASAPEGALHPAVEPLFRLAPKQGPPA